MRTRLAVAAGLALAAFGILPAAPAAGIVLGPFVTFLFSRTEQVPAVGCIPDTTGTAALNTVVAPWMQSQGLTGFGTVNTLATTSAEGCTHYQQSVTSSVGDLQQLAAMGWTSGPHEYDSATQVANLTAAQASALTCGQVTTLQSWGLGPSNGMIAYPGAQGLSPAIVNLQQNYSSDCIAWGRTYGSNGLTPASAATTAPYWQKTMALRGGPGKGSRVYTNPQTVITAIENLQPGQWMTIQVYLLVTGTNPPGDSITWKCDQGVPNTSNDVERYCYTDFQKVAAAAAALVSAGKLTVTGPLTVAGAFGRSGY
jgi:hypothetical protein